jgi:hypothetical protein
MHRERARCPARRKRDWPRFRLDEQEERTDALPWVGKRRQGAFIAASRASSASKGFLHSVVLWLPAGSCLEPCRFILGKCFFFVRFLTSFTFLFRELKPNLKKLLSAETFSKCLLCVHAGLQYRRNCVSVPSSQSWAFQTQDVLPTENSPCVTFKQSQCLYSDTSQLWNLSLWYGTRKGRHIYIQLYIITLWQLSVHCIKQCMPEGSASLSAVYHPVPRQDMQAQSGPPHHCPQLVPQDVCFAVRATQTSTKWQVCFWSSCKSGFSVSPQDGRGLSNLTLYFRTWNHPREPVTRCDGGAWQVGRTWWRRL